MLAGTPEVRQPGLLVPAVAWRAKGALVAAVWDDAALASSITGRIGTIDGPHAGQVVQPVGQTAWLGPLIRVKATSDLAAPERPRAGWFVANLPVIGDGQSGPPGSRERVIDAARGANMVRAAADSVGAKLGEWQGYQLRNSLVDAPHALWRLDSMVESRRGPVQEFGEGLSFARAAELSGVAMAMQHRVEIAVTRIADADRELAGALCRALFKAITIPGDGPANDALSLPVLSDLDGESEWVALANETDDGMAAIVAAAAVWLAERNAPAFHIVDDASGFDAVSGQSVLTALCVNFGPQDQTATVRTMANRTEPTLIKLLSGRGELVRVRSGLGVASAAGVWAGPGAAESREGIAGAETLAEMLVGNAMLQRPVIGGLVPVLPPGRSLGPLLSLTDSVSLLSGVPRVAMRQGRLLAQGMLQRSGYRSTGNAGEGWTIYLQLAVGDEPFSVECYLGGRDGPARVLRWSSRAGDGSSNTAATVRVSRGGITEVWIPVPADAIARGATLQLGLKLTVGEGAASNVASWPRPMLPGQVQPGRLLLDVGEWTRGVAP